MKRALASLLAGFGLAILAASPAVAATATLQLAPLKYQATLHAGSPQTGYVTVSNPSDTAITVRSQVQAVHQTGTNGDLTFNDDAAITAAITISADNVTLAPHEAVNFQFLINPDKLPQGGVYASIFFRTVPPTSGLGTEVLTSARVGTLLLLDNGNSGTRRGTIDELKLPWLAIGPELIGTALYRNTGTVARNPHLAARVSTWGSPQVVDGPYILPQATRLVHIQLKGSYLGPIHVVISETETGASAQFWTLAITGFWVWLLPLLIVAIAILTWRYRAYRRHFRPRLY